MELHERPAYEQALIFMLKSRLSIILKRIDTDSLQNTLNALGRAFKELEYALSDPRGLQSPDDPQ